MSKTLDRKYIDSQFRGETWLVMTHLLEQKGVPISTNKIAECTGVDRGNVSSRLCVMRAIGAVTSAVSPDNPRQFTWVLNPTIPTRYRKRTKAKKKPEVKAVLKKSIWETVAVASSGTPIGNGYANRVVEVPVKPKPEKGKIGVLLELIDAWKVPYAEAVEILHILAKRE